MLLYIHESNVLLVCSLSYNMVCLLSQTEQSYKKNPKMLDQLQYCEGSGIPLAIVIGGSEIENNVVKIRNILTREEVGERLC